MTRRAKKKKRVHAAPVAAGLGTGIVFVALIAYINFYPLQYDRAVAAVSVAASSTVASPWIAPKPQLDTVAYDKKLLQLANYGTTSSATNTASTSSTSTPVAKHLWPTKAPYPKAGAILPFQRIIAYYGNFYSKGMGVLGEYPEDVMLQKLQAEIDKWEAADPTTPVMPAIDYIAVTAQGSPGKDGKYRLRMPDSQIDKAVEIAKKVDGIVILDVQVGLSTVQVEIPELENYLKMPQVHLAIDPEFSMKGGEKPGTVIGTFNANDVNWVAAYLAKLVRDNELPPKILIIHRFTQPMVTQATRITPLPEVQVVMDMDGWGSPIRKIGTYQAFIYPEPVQFTGFKLFYKNDLKSPSTRLLTPAELLKLKPQPSFIQFQ